MMLTDAVLEGGGVGRFLKPRAAGRTFAGLALHPRRTARDTGRLGVELARVAAGRSEARPDKGDRRFGERAWEDNWLLRRLMQSYLATCDTVDRLISDAGLDWRTERQARFAASNVLDALAPTNFPWSNPAVLKESIDVGGANLVRGGRRFVHDMTRPPHLPASVDVTKFEVGGNLAVTPGSVVLRTDVFELIQYRPSSKQVREVPLLFVPPTINKYYILDISPGRSMVEWLLDEQQQVFTISWRNPDAAQGHFDLDTYARAVLEARDAVAEITGQTSVNVNAACSGGIITACALGHLAAIGEQGKFGALTMMVCALDQARMGTRGRSPAASSPPPRWPSRRARATSTAARSRACSRGCGPTTWSGTTSSTITCWARTRRHSTSCTGTRTACGWRPACIVTSSAPRSTTPSLSRERSKCSATPIDLGEIKLDTYAIAGLRDHIVPWENAYRSIQLFGGAKRFVLSTSGHIQALVNPPGSRDPRQLPRHRRSRGRARDVVGAGRRQAG